MVSILAKFYSCTVEKTLVYWICVSINPYFLQTRGESLLPDLFFEIFGNDYVEHYLIDYDEFEKNYDIDRYAFVYCREYKPHIQALQNNRHIKNVLNSFNNIVTIPEKEILATRSSVSNIIYDEDYCINRTGFFMFGDIVRIIRGSLSSMNGIVICRQKDNTEFYTVYFRLFVHRFFKQIHISNMDFDTSIFKYLKIPVLKGQLTSSKKMINRIIRTYNLLMNENEQKKLVDMPTKTYREDEIDIANVISNQYEKSEEGDVK